MTSLPHGNASGFAMRSEQIFVKKDSHRRSSARRALAGTVLATTAFVAALSACSSPPEQPPYAAHVPADDNAPATKETLRREVDMLLAEAGPEAGFPPYLILSANLENYANFLIECSVKRGVPAPRAAVPITALLVAEALDRRGDTKAALNAFNDIVFLFPDSDYAAEALYRQGVIYNRTRQFSDAFECFSALEDSYPASPRIEDAIAQSYIIVEEVRNGVRPLKNGWLPWFKDRTEGLTLYDRLYEMAPHASISPRLLYHKGKLAFELSDAWFSFDKTDDAIDAFERLISIYPDAPFVPEAYLELAGTYEAGVVGADWDQLATRRAINYYTDFYSLFPDHPKAEFAYEKTVELTNIMAANRLVVGDFYYERHNNLRAAATFYNEAITIAPDSPAGKQAAVQLARVRRGERSDRTLVDWIFGRYPNYDAVDYLDAPSLRPLDEMGFRSNNTSSGGNDENASGTSAAASTDEAGSVAGPENN